MKAFIRQISKTLSALALLLALLLALNLAAFGGSFYRVVAEDYGEGSPTRLLEELAPGVSPIGLPREDAQRLRQWGIWALVLDGEGRVVWSADAPAELPARFSVQEVAVFAKGYLAGYPVFTRSTDGGLLVLGYPRDSYTKLPGNYLPLRFVRRLPAFALGLLAADLLALLLAWGFSRRRILKRAGPIIAAVEALGRGEAVSLSPEGELADLAESVNRTAGLLRRQDRARAEWINGISHDIRTPLAVIMGYAERIAGEKNADPRIRREAGRIGWQSMRIKELVQDLNLASQLEYGTRPPALAPLSPAALLREYGAELLNAGLPEGCSLEMEIAPETEGAVLNGDARLLSRAVNNLVQNSLRHNPAGCRLSLGLCREAEGLGLYAADDGVGLTAAELEELRRRTESGESSPELRHGLGLVLVSRIARAHGGSLRIESEPGKGCRVTLILPTA